MYQGGINLCGFVYADSSATDQSAIPQAMECVTFDPATINIQIEDFAEKVLSEVKAAAWREACRFRDNNIKLDEMCLSVKITCMEINYAHTRTISVEHGTFDKLDSIILCATSTLHDHLCLEVYRAVLSSEKYRNQR